MMQRRYSDTEVAEIFRRAAEAQHRSGSVAPLASGEGMTLSELQAIGKDVGIPSEFIALAARNIERTGKQGTKVFAGIPIGVSRTVTLPRRLTDAEWERLVVELRDTFDARGRLAHEGTLRQWTNGNLQVLLEPMGDTHQLRMRTRNGMSQTWITAGMAVTGVGAVTLIAALTGDVPRDGLWVRFFPMLLMGGAFFTIGVTRLRGWLRTRRRQFEELAGTVVSTAETPP